MKTLIAILLSITPFLVFSAETKSCVDWDCGEQFEAEIGSPCEGWKFNIEPDMQIKDSDLTKDRVQESIQWLSENIEKRGVVYSYGKANRLKVIKGFILKQDLLVAEMDDKMIAQEIYCNWLKTEGFWYD